jgi:hypothetical protein
MGSMINSIAELKSDLSDKDSLLIDIVKIKQKYSTFENLLEGCQVIDNTWHYVYINKVAAYNGHYPQDFYLGRSLIELYPGIEGTNLFNSLKSCLKINSPKILRMNLLTRMDPKVVRVTYPTGTGRNLYLID